jgi:TonB family protein
MQLESTKIIDRYLSGELSPSEHSAFEERLKTSEKLQKEVEIHEVIKEAAVRASVRADVRHAARRYKLNRIIKWGATGLGIVAVIISTSIWISSSNKKSPQQELIPTIAMSLMDQLNPNADFNPLPIQYFSVPKEGDIFLSDQSVLLSIPPKAFLLKNEVYVGEAIVQFQEAMKANEIVKAGLNTMSGDNLLETQGMFSIHAYTPEGTELSINSKVGIYVQVPVNEYKDGMNLYDYVELADGTADWQNPRGLSKIPVPVDMKNLDFYPEGYEAELNKLKWKKGKSKRDSLYLSFEDYCGVKSDAKESTSAPVIPEDKIESRMVTSNSVVKPIVTRGSIVRFPDVDAQFPGGIQKMKEFFYRTLIYPEASREQGISGTVYVEMEIDEFGFISNERILQPLDPNLDQEALRMIRKMPKWIPAQDRNGSVRTRVRLPVKFLLEGDSGKPITDGVELMLRRSNRKPRPSINVVSKREEAELIPQDLPEQVIDQDTLEMEDTPCNYPHVAPSKVLAFWKPTFNNTNLAPREFERRMKAIHRTCNDEVLRRYTSQLTKPISEIDRGVVNMGYSDFGLFANEQVGAVNPNNPHLENIKAFYEKGVSALKEQAKSDKNWEQQLRNKWDKNLADLRDEHSKSTKNLQEKSKRDEVTYNQQRTVQKLGLNNKRRMSAVAAYPQFGQTIGFTARRSGGYNCDRSVQRIVTYQAAIRPVQNPNLAQERKIERMGVSKAVKNGTEKRETFKVTTNGKIRTISYNSLSFEVSHSEKYTKIIAYAFPHQLESYQLLNGKDGKYSTSMNDDIIYDICIVGISNEGYSYFQKQTLKGGDLGSINLKRITESKLDASILQMNSKRTVKPASMSLDLNWIKAEKNYFKEVNRRKEMTQFREKMVTVIYPCYELSDIESPKVEALKEEQTGGPIETAGDVNSFGI